MKKRSARTETHSKRQQQPLSKSQSQTFPSHRHEFFGHKKTTSSRSDLYSQLSSVFHALLPPPPAEPSHISKKTSTAGDTSKKKSRQKAFNELKIKYISSQKMSEEPAEAPPAEEVAPAEGEAPAEAPAEGGEAAPEAVEELPIGPAPEGVEGAPTRAPAQQGSAPASEPPSVREGSISTWNNFPLIDSAVLNELKEANANAIKTSKLIESMRKDIMKFRKKKDMTEKDLQNVRKMNDALSAKLSEFEQIANNIQRLLGIADLTPSKLAIVLGASGEEPSANVEKLEPTAITEPEKMVAVDRIEQLHLTASEEEKLTKLEDKLPKVIVCGTGKEKEIPKLIVCGEQGKEEKKISEMTESLTQKLDNSYKMQERLVNDNVEMEGCRYLLQEALLNKDRALESLQKKVESLQNEMKLIAKENADLQKKLLQTCQPPHPPLCKKELFLKFGGMLPNNEDGKPPTEGRDPIENEIEHMEGIVNEMKTELCCVQEERKKLNCQAQMLQCCFSHLPSCIKEAAKQHQEGQPTGSCVKELEGKYRELTEQYCTLEKDYKDKLCEISCLRSQLKNCTIETEQLTQRSCCADATIEDLIGRMKVLEAEKAEIMVCRDQFIDIQQQFSVCQQNLICQTEKVESLEITVEEQKILIEDYQSKYHKAQETVEGQKLIIRKIHSDVADIEEALIQELKIFKKTMQEKVDELTPLPAELKTCQTKLVCAHHNIEQITKELVECRAEVKRLTDETPSEKKLREELDTYKTKLTEKTKEIKEVKDRVCKLEVIEKRLTDLVSHYECLLEEKSSQVTQLETQLSTLRTESARQVCRTKQRCKTARSLMIEQISILEKELIESRAIACAASKEKEEIQSKMEQQITVLGDNFTQAQQRIKCLQENINVLKTSPALCYP